MRRRGPRVYEVTLYLSDGSTRVVTAMGNTVASAGRAAMRFGRARRWGKRLRVTSWGDARYVKPEDR